MYRFGKSSLSKLETCHPDLQKILLRAISVTPIDFGISEGHRSIQRQKQLYDEGKSKIDGMTRKGKHNHTPSMAVDIYIYHPNLKIRRKLAYDKQHLSFVAGIIICVAKDLLRQGVTTHSIRWGANWNGNGVIDYDQSFDDFPHFELINP